MDTLEKQVVSEYTLILFISDNGRPFPRDKTTMYDSGIKTPWIVKWPDRVEAGSHTQSLVSSVDIGNTFLSLAGADLMEHSPGVDFSPVLKDPNLVVRDRIFGQAHWHDHENFVRAVRDRRFKYIRTFFNDLSLTPPADALNSGVFAEIREQEHEGRLDAMQKATYFEPRPEEELYDVQNDLHELNNLADDPAYRDELNRLRGELLDFMETHNDGVPRLRTPDEFHRVCGASLPNNFLPRAPKKEMFGDCECIYQSPAKFFE